MITKELFKNDLFNECDINHLSQLIDESSLIIKTYKEDAIIVQEYEECSSIGFITKGSLYINQLLEDGETIRIKLYKESDAFGCALFGAKVKNYPFTLIAHEDTEIIHIPFSQIQILLMNDTTFMMNFINLLSNNILSLKEKIKILSLKSVREKILFYLSKNTNNGMTHLNHTKTEISKILGIARGSVSRELKKMQEENIITFIDKNTLRLSANHLPH